MKFVMPGDKIGCKEEFLAGEGIYEENGDLFAAVAGKVVVKDKVISVEPIKIIPEIEKGDVVLGRIIDVRNSIALVELSRKKGLDRDLKNMGLAALHISNVQNEYLKDLSSAVRYMDIIKARVIEKEGLKLSTQEDEMGVIKAICSICKHEMLRYGDVLKCPNCGNVEKRKLSSDYGKGEW